MSDFYDTDPYRTNISDLACLEAPAAIGTLAILGLLFIFPDCRDCGCRLRLPAVRSRPYKRMSRY